MRKGFSPLSSPVRTGRSSSRGAELTLIAPTFDEEELVARIQDPRVIRQEWSERANCRTVDPDLYFPDEGAQPPLSALARCASCPVATDCLATALFHEIEDDLRYGWWGGLGPVERRELSRRLGLPVSVPDPTEADNPVTQALRLRAQHHTIPTIAAELGCSERTVYRILAAHAA
jgi:WhiB family redox-sensing transcriptional regulator